MKTSAQRAEIAEEMIRTGENAQWAQTGHWFTSAQIADIHKRAQQGEFDQYWVAIGKENPDGTPVERKPMEAR